ncbi:uncharacterized protein LOC111700499 [Eurytemora carolleeae]|uniref:uncharacterized protein LOC111700499 n=1 Tax=Eurytemora carolleeae TaxID=1294199 RepID=UPI000C77BA95|nr:uncharacterized protein LOC111700499 [Eurytemora carolleeae]|eukprot:XP_023327199.1 uncharacterized protein LOC111700499 [Eurytemora affinis]
MSEEELNYHGMCVLKYIRTGEVNNWRGLTIGNEEIRRWRTEEGKREPLPGKSKLYRKQRIRFPAKSRREMYAKPLSKKEREIRDQRFQEQGYQKVLHPSLRKGEEIQPPVSPVKEVEKCFLIQMERKVWGDPTTFNWSIKL